MGAALLASPMFAPSAGSQEYDQPESAVYDTPRDRYLVSNYGDGTIIQIDSAGALSYFASDLIKCAGLHIVGDTLYVARAQYGLRTYSLSTDEPVSDLVIPGMHFLNDVTSDGSEFLYLTDWFPGGCKIYRLSIADHTASAFLDGGFSYTNGILFDGRHGRLLTVGYIGNDYTCDYIISIDLQDSTVTETFDPGVRGFDGLALDNDGSVYFSAWTPNAVYRYLGGDLNGTAELVESGLIDPADIYFDLHNNVLVVPNFSVDTVDFLPMQFSSTATGGIVSDGGCTQGISWVDYDNDGYPDVFATNLLCPDGQNNWLYHNEGDRTFTRILLGSIVNDDGMSRTSTWGDFDNDGDADAFVTNWPEQVNFLYENKGGGTFSRVTTGEMVTEVLGSPAAAWADYNNDGLLDMFVANYGANSLFTNEGGSFTKVSGGDIATDVFDSYGVAWADYDNDGDQDLFVANPGENGSDRDNRLYENGGDGSFTRVGDGLVVTDGGESFGGSWGDYDNDGDLDLFVTNISYETDGNNFLYQNEGDGTFQPVTEGPIVTDEGYSFGSGWGDYDNDGYLDLFVANCPYNNESRDFLYHNKGDGTFTKVAGGSIVNEPGASYGCAWGDYDGDGDLDLMVARMGDDDEDNALYHNNGNLGNWLAVTCIGTTSNASAIGARVRLKAHIDGEPIWQLREISSQTGYCGQNSTPAHFGLGDAEVVDSLRIRWPSGLVDLYIDLSPNQFLTVTEGEALEAHGGSLAEGAPELLVLHPSYPNPADHCVRIGFELSAVAEVNVAVFNMKGHLVRTLLRGSALEPGPHTVWWDGRTDHGDALRPGRYLCRIRTADSGVGTQPLLLSK
jgi:hypothetical protein